MTSTLTRSALVALATALMAVAPVQATILTFDGVGVPADSAMDQNYGDNVTSILMGAFGYGVGAEGFTPNVTVTYDPSPTIAPAWCNYFGYGNLGANVLEQANGSGSQIKLTLTSSAGPVQLYGFDMGVWGTTGMWIL